MAEVKKMVIAKDDTDMYIVNSFKRLLKNTSRDSKLISVENFSFNNIEEDDCTTEHSRYPDARNNNKTDCIFDVLVELKSQLEIVTANYQCVFELKK